jgi:hypothetical protein
MAIMSLNEMQKQAAVAIAKSYWSAAFKSQFPKATKEQKLASWKQHRREYVRLGRMAVRQLLRSGFELSASPRERVAR